MGIVIPPKHAVASVSGFLKGKSVIHIALLRGKEQNYEGESFWARGYFVSTVGRDEDQIRRYIHGQEGSDGGGCF